MIRSNSQNKKYSQRSLLRFLVSYWWVYGLGVVFIFSFNIYKFQTAIPIYESALSFVVETSEGGHPQDFSPSLVGIDVLERLRNQLAEKYQAHRHPPHLDSFFHQGTLIPANILKNFLSLTLEPKKAHYKVRCEATNPSAAHDICTAYLETIRDYFLETKVPGGNPKLVVVDFPSRNNQHSHPKLIRYLYAGFVFSSNFVFFISLILSVLYLCRTKAFPKTEVR